MGHGHNDGRNETEKRSNHSDQHHNFVLQRCWMFMFVVLAPTAQNVNLLANGITFDTAGLNASTTAVMTGPGGLTKKGLGTLTVNSVQAYTGTTRVEAGTLSLVETYLASGGDVYLYTGAVLDLQTGDVNNIGDLYIDRIQDKPPRSIGGRSLNIEVQFCILNLQCIDLNRYRDIAHQLRW